MSTDTPARVNRQVRRLLAAADTASSGARREGDELRPLGEKASRTRDALLGAAYDQFVAQGYRATTVQDIHEAAEVSIGTFYQYFRHKADVMAALVGVAVLAAARQIFPPFDPTEPEDSVNAVVGGFVRNYAATAEFQRVWEEATHFEAQLAEFRWQVSQVIEGSLRDAITAGQASGAIDTALSADATSIALTAMVDRYCYRTFVVEDHSDDATIAETIDVLAVLWRNTLRLGDAALSG